jgi:hypothetical protein
MRRARLRFLTVRQSAASRLAPVDRNDADERRSRIDQVVEQQRQGSERAKNAPAEDHRHRIREQTRQLLRAVWRSIKDWGE